MAFLLGRKGRRQKEEAVEHTRKEVNFWKQELEYTVAEKNAWKEKFFDAYQQNDALRQQSKRLEMEKAHAEWERDRLAAGGPGQGADVTTAARGAPRSEGSLASGSSCPSSPEPPCLQRQLASARQQLRQADVRIAMLEERVLALQHERDLLGRQCELLTASEAAVQQEVVMLREELNKSDRINSLTADETTKLLLDNSRVAQANAALQVEVMHKDEVVRLLNQQISELCAALDAADPEGAASQGGLLMLSSSGGGGAAALAAMSAPAAPPSGRRRTNLGSGPGAAAALERRSAPAGDAAALPGAGGGASGGGGAGAGGESCGVSADGTSREGGHVPRIPRLDLGPLQPGERRGAFTGETITPRDMKEFEQQQLAQKEQKLKQRRHRLGRQLRSHMLERASPSPTPTPGRDMSHAPDGASAANESAGRGGAGAQAAGGPKQGGPRGAAAKAVGAAGVVEAPVEDEGVLSDEHHSVLTGSPKLASCAAGSAAGSTNAPRAPPAPPLRLSSLTLPGAERPAASEGSVRQGGAAAVGAGEAQSGGPRGATLTRTPTTIGPVPDSDGDCSVGSTSGAAPRSTPGTPRSFGAPSSPFAGRGGARGAWNGRGGAAAPAAVFSEVAARAGVGSLSSTTAPPPDVREAAPPAAAAAGVAVNAAAGQDGAASAGRGQADVPVLEVDLPTGVPQRQAALLRLEAQQQQQLQLARERGSSARAAEAGRSARQRKDAIAALAAQEQQRLGIDSPTAAAAAKADAERSALPSGEAKAVAADGYKAGPRPKQRGQEHARAAAAGAGADGIEPQLQPKTAGAGSAQKGLQADRRAPQGGGAGGPASESAEDEEGVVAVVTQRGDQGADSAAAKEQADAGAADGGCAKTSTITVKRLLRETTPSRIPPAPAPPQEWGAQGGQAGLLSRVKSIPAPQKNA